MSTIIDADAVKLAGLQIDLLQKMRQGHVTLSHFEWFVGLSKDARDRFMTVGGGQLAMNSILEFISTVIVPATTCTFVAREEFVRDTSENAEVSIRYLGDNFTEWFLKGNGKIENAMAEQVLRYAKLQKPSVDGPIIAELGGEATAEMSLTTMFSLMREQGHGQPGVLLNNGYINIFYIRDTGGVLRTVIAHWLDGGWLVHAGSVEHPLRWRGSGQVFSRNFVLDFLATVPVQ
ncbi:MAG: Uncharacterized protein G01um101448_61 [Parcubacteria group bacterium Gr01-1014_48]|nr:MAG: Uncharacterized protein Greene041614_143 [Parcubacteria group bacterium Greene0416_14]TSC74542.1 MAG: Uncharacterized protein G01um101448_61 [Parcubacteria group bacterium Gr01-1014_48]TSD01418.1 MAG: Uncharacterized protein Greene101415_265 [Parcubacteria group bacterium Greene1014_15]TSD08440.1 MAG: Uncharacterized protein Greene07144_70 [Parcubacteria group bacterium Greene0714_4]